MDQLWRSPVAFSSTKVWFLCFSVVEQFIVNLGHLKWWIATEKLSISQGKQGGWVWTYCCWRYTVIPLVFTPGDCSGSDAQIQVIMQPSAIVTRTLGNCYKDIRQLLQGPSAIVTRTFSNYYKDLQQLWQEPSTTVTRTFSNDAKDHWQWFSAIVTTTLLIIHQQ